MRLFPVKYRGEEHQVMVDDEDAARIDEVLRPPHRGRSRRLSYVPAWKNRGFRPAIWADGKLQYLSRWLLGVKDSSVVVDHIDQNPLNSCRANLRILDKRENAYNSGKRGWDRPNKTSQYRGVSWNTQSQKWQAKIVLPNGRQMSKFYDSELAAAHARDHMVLDFLHRNDCLNFSHWSEDKEQS